MVFSGSPFAPQAPRFFDLPTAHLRRLNTVLRSARQRRFALLLAAGLFFCGAPLAGCGPSTAPVRGQVTLDGDPAGPGTVIFIPETKDGEQRESAVGHFGPDGRYELTTFTHGDGALLGQHRIVVQARGESGASYGEEAAAATSEAKIPLRYADPQQSGLTATVEAGVNEIDLPLKLQPQ